MWSGCQAEYSLTPSTDFKNQWICNFTPSYNNNNNNNNNNN